MVTFRQRFWRTVTRTVTRTHRQRYWKTRKDGVRQRYWRTVTRRVRVKHRQRYWKTVTRKPRMRRVEFARFFRGGKRYGGAWEMRIQKEIPWDANPADYWPTDVDWGKAERVGRFGEVFDPKLGGGFTDGIQDITGLKGRVGKLGELVLSKIEKGGNILHWEFSL